MSELWPVQTLAELAADEPNSITDGPFGSKLKSEHYTQDGPRVIRLQNIGDATFVDARAHISEARYLTLQKHRVFPGDIIIAALGENPPRSRLVPESLGPAIVKADCIRFKAGPRILPKFLNYALNSPDLRHHAKGIIHGVGRPRLNLGEIKVLPIPVPPLPEQRRIVAEIEKQLTRLEAGVAALRRVQANLKRYRAAVLKAACEGRLVPTEGKWKQIPLKELIGKISQGWSPKCNLSRDALPDEWAIITTTAVRFRCHESRVVCGYLELALNSPSIVETIDRQKSGINESGVSLTHNKLRVVLIPAPPSQSRRGSWRKWSGG